MVNNLRWMKFDGFTGVKTVFIDNVYAWKDGTSTSIMDVNTLPETTKTIIDGQLIIIRDGIRYNAQGQVIE